MNAVISIMLAFIGLGLIRVRTERTRIVAMIFVIMAYVVYAYYSG
jgi:hypothetical protein